MADYWGARAQYSSGGPRGEGTRYVMPRENPDLTFTPAPTGEGGNSIEVVRRQVLAQHPEDISALADQWQNAYNLLQSVHQQLLTASQTLHDEHWKSPQARDAFLQAGPGKALAYLDEWMDAALNNVAALRAMVGIAHDSRAEMERLWTEYKNAVEDAKTAGDWTQFSEGFKQGFTLGLYDGEKGIQAAEAEAVQEKQKEYNRKAQELAHRVANEYFDTMSKVSGGHGPPFFPMDAVLNPVGHPPWRGPVGSPPGVRTPGGRPKGAPPPSVRSVPRIAPTDPKQLERQILAGLKPPPAVGAVDPSLKTAPSTPPAPAVAPPPTVAYPVVGPPPGLANARAAAPGAGRAGLARPPSVEGLTAGERGALRSGVIRAGGGAPAVSEPPQASLRSPGANATPPPTGGRGTPPSAARGSGTPSTSAPPSAAGRRPGAPGSAAESTRLSGRGTPSRPGTGAEPFGRGSGGTTPPVLQNRRPDARRPAGGGELTSSGRAGGPSAPGRPGTAPPVLGSPAKGSGTPAPLGPVRRGPGDARRTTPPGSEWVGDGQLEATAPVLDAPAPPPTGGRVSRLEEVPSALRGRPTPGTAARPARGGSTVPPELAPRRTNATASGSTGGRDEHEIVTDEQAFSVETPGGGVLGKQAEDRSYRVEPKTALGGN